MKVDTNKLREAFWKEDQSYGGVIHTQYEQIKYVLKNKDFEFVKKQLNAIKEHAIANTDFYHDYSIEDIFPVVNKMILTENKNAILAKRNFDLPCHTTSTSGSTGTPFEVIQDYKKRKRTIADLKVFGELADYPSHERMLFFRAFSNKLHRTAEQEERENIYYIDCSDLSKSGLQMMKEEIIKKEPRIIFSYPSTLIELAKYISDTGKPDNGFTMKSVLMAGESIYEEERKLLEKIFGCKVYRRYSDMELGILGQDDGNGGAYDLNWGSYYFECLKLDSDEAAETGEIGRIVITDLFNYAFPMIRYDTGDLGILEYKADNLPVLKEIYGRKLDCIYDSKNKLLSPYKISVQMWGAEGVRQWQFIQESAKTYVLKLNCSKKIDRKIYIDKFKKLLGEDADIRIKYVDEIPVLASNKRRNIICNYKKG